MVYSLMPHTGDWREQVVSAAYDLNDPLILRHFNGSAATKSLGSLVNVSVPNVVIETIKLAEDGNGVIVRLFENQRNRGKFALRTNFALAQAYICNLLEENEPALAVATNEIELEIAPYQIISLRLVPQR
jgi:alpha-mannosidase